MKSPFNDHAGTKPSRLPKAKNEKFKQYLKRNLLHSKMGIAMRIVTILLTICCLQASAFADAQVTISVKDAPLEKVFSLIKKQAGVLILYNQKDLAGAKNVSLNLKNATLQEALETCMVGQNLKFSIEGKSVFISKKQPVLNNNTIPDSLINIQGKVTDVKNSAIAGATITVKGSEIATSTKVDGSFSINGVRKNAILLISSVGYEQKIVKIEGESRISIRLNVNAQAMQEITVYNTGFQNVPKERATGSFEKINNELLSRSINSNIIDRLEGVTNGLLFDRRIDQNGRPKNNLQIRGLFTLTEFNSQPLVILDNFPYSGDINNINPNDIESVTILRDAAAASIWGAKAGNGVIVLTSKKGRYQQPMRVSANANFTTIARPDLFGLPLINADDWIDLEQFYYSKGAYNRDINGRLRPPISPVVQILQKLKNGEINDAEADAEINNLKDNDVRDDFLKYVYRRSMLQQYSANISGGGIGFNYILSLGYDKSNSELIGKDNDRISVRLSNNFQPIKNLELSATIGYTHGISHNNTYGGFQNSNYNPSQTLPLPMYSRLVDENGNPLPIPKRFRLSHADTLGGGQLLDWTFNPLKEMNFLDDRSITQAFIAVFGGSYKFTKFLDIDVQYQFQKNSLNQKNISGLEIFNTRDLINLFTNLNSNISYLRNPVPVGGILNETNQNLTSNSIRGSISFNHTFNEKHKIVALVGGSIDENRVLSNSGRTYGYDKNLNSVNVDLVNSYPTILGFPQVIPTGTVNFDDRNDRFVSFFSNLSYTYDGKYTLSGSTRRDASNLFGVETNNRWKPLWSVGGAWNISKETFYKVNAFPYLSLRTTYGYAGNVNNTLSAYNILMYQPAAYNEPINVPSANVSKLGNPNLRWEQVSTFNVGVDFAFRNQIFGGSLEYYSKRSIDVVSGQPLDITTGYGLIQTNTANMKGKGWDIKFVAKPISESNIKWDILYNFNYASYEVSKVLQQANNGKGYSTNGIQVQAIEGYTPYLVVSYKWAGLDPLTGDPQGLLNGKISKNYDSIVNFSPFKDQVIHGSAVPIIYGNLLNTISWKKLSLSANITYKLKYFVRKGSMNYGMLVVGNGHSEYYDRWMKPGDESKTHVPSFVYPSSANRDMFYQNSEINVIPGDHIRLEDVRISYSVETIGALKLREVSLFGYLGNLNIFIWRKNKLNVDPNFPLGNISRKSFSLGVRLGL